METPSFIKEKVKELLKIVNELEMEYPDRKFSLDGHLLGSIGEVLAMYYYGIELSKPSAKTHDGVVDGKSVQIKITQIRSVDISGDPDYLLVLFLNKSEGTAYEVYNGPSAYVLNGCKKTRSGWYTRQLSKLLEIDATIKLEERIKHVEPIGKWNSSMTN